ncbi:MAG: response regulator transcription factor [Geothrix sp.]|uniref:response regulator n=1 Tax=Geothrix sp. TaxID=1962974 RepID=UPI0017C2B4A7|nr:response regulator transcription factor [Geothrix sp.]NWJ40799.1 response regulator transcription factor [Geothrix sp.]WIL21199.1 MAG: response regulator transcription factor [Geothrix sp.]
MAEGRRRVVIVEDQTLMREGLRMLLSTQAHLEIVGEGVDGREAVHLAGQLRPELMVLSLSLPGFEGPDSLMAVRRVSPGTRILALAVDRAEESICSALQAGACGYVMKDSSGEELFQAIESVLAGEKYLSPAIATTVVAHFLGDRKLRPVHAATGDLSDREREVLKLVAEGHRSKAIAEFLGISPKTVEKHRASLMKKLDLHTIQALTALAIKKGLVAQGHRPGLEAGSLGCPDPMATLSG